MFCLPEYREPAFTEKRFTDAPDAAWEKVTIKGVAPENYHSTSMYPEYFKINGKWTLAEESRMDSSVVLCDDGHLKVVENRNLEIGDKVILGRTENGQEGIYLHANAFEDPDDTEGDQFVFRQGRSRETSYARDYDRLFELLKYEKSRGIRRGEVFVTATGRSLSRKQVWQEMKKECARAGVEPGKVFPHNLRHLFARCFYEASRDVTKLADVLGHSSIDTTRIYLMTSFTEHERFLEALSLVS